MCPSVFVLVFSVFHEVNLLESHLPQSSLPTRQRRAGRPSRSAIYDPLLSTSLGTHLSPLLISSLIPWCSPALPPFSAFQEPLHQTRGHLAARPLAVVNCFSSPSLADSTCLLPQRFCSSFFCCLLFPCQPFRNLCTRQLNTLFSTFHGSR